MHLEADLVGELQSVIQGSETFNNRFNNWIRDLDVPYYTKISLVKSGGNVSCYPCDQKCKVNPRHLITKVMSCRKGNYLLESSDGKEDERCFSSCELFPIDIKYLNVKQIETYLEKRFEAFARKDIESHKENEPLYRVLTPELFVKTEKTKETTEFPEISA